MLMAVADQLLLFSLFVERLLSARLICLRAGAGAPAFPRGLCSERLCPGPGLGLSLGPGFGQKVSDGASCLGRARGSGQKAAELLRTEVISH